MADKRDTGVAYVFQLAPSSASGNRYAFFKSRLFGNASIFRTKRVNFATELFNRLQEKSLALERELQGHLIL